MTQGGFDESIQNALNLQNTLKGTRLYGRRISLTVGTPGSAEELAQVEFNEQQQVGRDISGLDVEFVVEKSIKNSEPNTAKIKVYNLAEVTRKAMSGTKPLTVRLEAGYVGAVSQLYFAGVRSAWTVRDGTDFITHLESSDSIARPTGVRTTKKLQPNEVNGNIYRTMGPRVPLEDAFKQITTALGISEGNLQQALARRNNPRISSVNGASMLGNAARRMTDLCRSAGLEWWIDDGKLLLVNIADSLSNGTNAIEVSSDTGMWDGSPQVDSQGVVSVSTALIPGLAPGVLVNIDSLFVSGGYRIEKLRFVGNTRGNDWTAHLECVKY